MKITIEQLAEKLNSKVWEKDGKKRIYLKEGFNTKKMKTTTYVEAADGSFVVKCFVECDYQPYEWCRSQEAIVIENVSSDIHKIVESYHAVSIAEEDTGIELEENFKYHCQEALKSVGSIFDNVTFSGESAFFYLKEDLKRIKKNEMFGIRTTWLDGLMILGADSGHAKSAESIADHYNSLSIRFEQLLKDVRDFRRECKSLEDKGYKICGDSLLHGQAQVMMGGKNVGHIHFTTITLNP